MEVSTRDEDPSATARSPWSCPLIPNCRCPLWFCRPRVASVVYAVQLLPAAVVAGDGGAGVAARS